MLKERVRRLTDFVELGGYFFSFNYTYDEVAARKQFTSGRADLLEELARRFEALPELTAQSTEETLTALAEDRGLKRAGLIHATRLAALRYPGYPAQAPGCGSPTQSC